jgi:tetratricopeptide (TPR) repeat protein
LPYCTPRKFSLLILVLVLGAEGAPSSSGTPQSNLPLAQSLFEEGIKLLDAGHYLEAVDDFNRFKQSAPDDPRPYFYSGMALSQAGRQSAAASELKEAVRLAPDRPDYRVFQANVLVELKQSYEATKTLAPLEKAGARRQLDTGWLKLLAEVYYRLELSKDSLETLELLAEREPGDASIDFDRGKVYIVAGRRDLALESFKKSVAKSSENPAAYFELGKLLYERNELSAAKQALLEAERRDRNNPEYLYKLGSVCLALGEIDEATEHLKRAEPSASAFPEIYFALGRAYQKKGDRIKGEEYRRRFQEATSAKRERDERKQTAERFIAQGERQLDQGNSEKARALFEQAVQADPNRWDAHGYLAEMLLSSQDWQRAYSHLVEMEKIDPDSVVGNYLMARYWYKAKEYDRARLYAEKVKLSRPANSELRNLLGDIYRGLGRNEWALKEYQAAARLAPDRADFRENVRQLESQTPPR